jgi:hypothetical protein
MSQSGDRNVFWITPVSEIAVALGVLSILAIPALMNPSVPSNSGVPVEVGVGSDFQTAAGDFAPRSQRFSPIKCERRSSKSAPRVSDEFACRSIQKLATRFDFARQMVIAQSHVTDADIAELAQLAQLGTVAPTKMRAEELILWDWLVDIEAIDLSDAGNITDASIQEIAKLPGVLELYLNEAPVTDESLAKLAALKELRILNLSHTRVSDSGLRALSELHHLEVLELSGTSIGDDTLALIVKSNPGLQTLMLAKTHVTGASLQVIRHLKTLEVLDLAGCPIDDDDLEQIGDLRRLRSLVLAKTQITDCGAQTLVTLDDLYELNIRGTHIGCQGRSLIKAAFPDCDVAF